MFQNDSLNALKEITEFTLYIPTYFFETKRTNFDIAYHFNTFEDELNTVFLLPFCVYSKQREGNSVKEPER